MPVKAEFVSVYRANKEYEMALRGINHYSIETFGREEYEAFIRLFIKLFDAEWQTLNECKVGDRKLYDKFIFDTTKLSPTILTFEMERNDKEEEDNDV